MAEKVPMHITILTVGKVREKYLQQGIDEYLKRLQRYAVVQIVEVAEEQEPETLSPAEQQQVQAREGERLRKHLRDGQYCIALDIAGRQFTSEAFANHLETLAINAQPDLAFLIGGSLGLPERLRKEADLRLSFGSFTYFITGQGYTMDQCEKWAPRKVD